MKTRTLLAVLALATMLSACGSNTPTAVRAAPERAALDGGSLGPGHRDGGTSTDTTTLAGRGGSYGPGH